MAETYTGQVRNSVVVLDAGMLPLAEGMWVRVEPIDIKRLSEVPLRGTIQARRPGRWLPEDLAEDLDHDRYRVPEWEPIG